MNKPIEAGNHCIIVVTELFDKINAQRKLLRRPPVEDRAMASRCTLRFNVDKNRGVDFNNEKVLIEPHELEHLEKIINEQFGVYMENELVRLCKRPEAPRRVQPEFIPPLQVTPEPAIQNQGLFSKLKRILFG